MTGQPGSAGLPRWRWVLELKSGAPLVFLAMLSLAYAGACPLNNTIPSGAAIGDCFTLNVTGRLVQMSYNGSQWLPQVAYGSNTMYVNGTAGTDNQTQGYGTGTAAFKTIQYAIDQIPPVNTGDTVINIAGGIYYEPVTIQGKGYTGAYSITLQGQPFTTTGANLSGAPDLWARGNATADGKPISPSLMTDNGAFSAYGTNGLRGYFFTKDNATFYPILGNDNNTIKIAENAINSLTTYSIYAPPATQIRNTSSVLTVGYGQTGVYINSIYIYATSTNQAFSLQDNSITEMSNVYYIGGNTNNAATVTSSRLNFLRSYGYMPHASRFLLTLTGGAVAITTNSLLYSLGSTCIRANQISQVSGSPSFHIGSGTNQGYTLNSGQSTLFGQYFENFSTGVSVDYAGQITWQQTYWVGCVNVTNCVTKNYRGFNADSLFGDTEGNYTNITSDGKLSLNADDNSTVRMCVYVSQYGTVSAYRCGEEPGGVTMIAMTLIFGGIGLIYIATRME